MKTLQQQYLLIKEGKGSKDHFLKQARNLFPDFITPGNDYNTATQILKGKGILSEAVGGVVTMNPNSKPDWFKIFDTNLSEAVGVKNTKEYGDQNEFEKVEKEVQDKLDHNFDNKDEKNIDNVYGQSFLMGYYTEMKDPKNADKTVDELKAIVLKNMTKDVTYYNTKASFGIKDIGYTKDVVGGGDPVAPKGKYKSSGYGDMPKTKVVKEGLNESTKSMDFSSKDQKDWSEKKSKMYDVWVNKSNELVDLKDDLKQAKNRNDKDEVKRINNKILQKQIAIKTAKEEFQKLSESLNEGKKSNVHNRIKDLEKQNEVLALESKIAALDEAINELNQKVSLSESDDLAEMMDPKKINELKKDIKVLEKYKVTCEKKLSKLGGKKAVVDNEEIKENTASVGKNYPGTLTAEFDGEEQVLDGQDLHDFLTTILTAANNEDDFISKVEYGLTNTNSKLGDEDVESLKTWYNANQE